MHVRVRKQSLGLLGTCLGAGQCAVQLCALKNVGFLSQEKTESICAVGLTKLVAVGLWMRANLCM